MSYVQRRRFLWIIFVASIVLAAVVANATTLARLNFDDLAQQAAAVARLRRGCGASALRAIGMAGKSGRKRNLKLWSEIKGRWARRLPCTWWGDGPEIFIRAWMECRHFVPEKKFIYFCGASRESLTACWDGRREHFASRMTREAARNA